MIGAYRKFAVFEGRASRAEFWRFDLFFILFSAALIFAVLFLAFLFAEESSGHLRLTADILIIITLVWWLFSLLPMVSLAVRRMHDCDKSGAFMLIPIYGWIVLPLTRGSPGPNRYDVSSGEAGDTVTQEIASSPGICKQCNAPVAGNYCQNCGAPVNLVNIDGRYFIDEIKDVLDLQDGFFNSLKRLLVFPGISARRFIKSRQIFHCKTDYLPVFTSMLYTVAYGTAGAKHAAQYDPEIITHFDLIWDIAVNWLNDNTGYAFMIASFISAFVVKRVFREYKYNVFEILVLMCFLNGTLLIIGSVQEIIGYFLPLMGYVLLSVIIYCFMFIYFIWGVASFFDPRKVKNYFKALFSFMVPWIYAIFIIAFFVLVFDYAK